VKLKFADKDLETLCKKGYCSAYKQMSSNALGQVVSVLTMADSITDIEELITPPLFYGEKNTDGSVTIYLCEKWVFQMFITISDEENIITLNSLCQIEEKETING